VFSTAHREGGVDFAELRVVEPGQTLVTVPLVDLEPGIYPYLRLSVSFQHFTVAGWATVMGFDVSTPVEVAAFVEDETWIDEYKVGTEVVGVGGLRSQGYYGAWSSYTGVVQGQAPAGATTVPNPLDDTSPIPVGSCVVTGVFPEPLEIPAQPSGDLVLEDTLSTNHSFEWVDDGDGRWEPFSEEVVDMGVRGMELHVRR
jgi:hypothetical protein